MPMSADAAALFNRMVAGGLLPQDNPVTDLRAAAAALEGTAHPDTFTLRTVGAARTIKAPVGRFVGWRPDSIAQNADYEEVTVTYDSGPELAGYNEPHGLGRDRMKPVLGHIRTTYTRDTAFVTEVQSAYVRDVGKSADRPGMDPRSGAMYESIDAAREALYVTAPEMRSHIADTVGRVLDGVRDGTVRFRSAPPDADLPAGYSHVYESDFGSSGALAIVDTDSPRAQRPMLVIEPELSLIAMNSLGDEAKGAVRLIGRLYITTPDGGRRSVGVTRSPLVRISPDLASSRDSYDRRNLVNLVVREYERVRSHAAEMLHQRGHTRVGMAAPLGTRPAGGDVRATSGKADPKTVYSTLVRTAIDRAVLAGSDEVVFANVAEGQASGMEPGPSEKMYGPKGHVVKAARRVLRLQGLTDLMQAPKTNEDRLRVRIDDRLRAVSREGQFYQYAREEGDWFTPGINLERARTQMGGAMYGSPERLPAVATREMVQNAVDAVRGRPAGDRDVTITIEENSGLAPYWTITVADNGTGMLPETVRGPFTAMFDSDKPDGSSGGFGVAASVIFGAAATKHPHGPMIDSFGERREDPFTVTVETVAERPDGSKVKTIMETWGGTRSQTDQIRIREFPAAADAATGTTVSIAVEQAGGRQRDYLVNQAMDLVQKSDPDLGITARLPGRYDDSVPVEPSRTDRSVLLSETRPGFQIEVHGTEQTRRMVRAIMPIRNRGLYQFVETKEIHDEGIDFPEGIVVDIIPTVEPDDGNYPFNPQRDSLKPEADRALGEAIHRLAREGMDRRMRRIRETLGGGVNIDGDAQAASDVQRVVVDLSRSMDRKRLEAYAASPSMRAAIQLLDDVVNEATLWLARNVVDLTHSDSLTSTLLKFQNSDLLHPVGGVAFGLEPSTAGSFTAAFVMPVYESSYGAPETRRILFTAPGLASVRDGVHFVSIALHEMVHLQHMGHYTEYAYALTDLMPFLASPAGRRLIERANETYDRFSDAWKQIAREFAEAHPDARADRGISNRTSQHRIGMGRSGGPAGGGGVGRDGGPVSGDGAGRPGGVDGTQYARDIAADAGDADAERALSVVESAGDDYGGVVPLEQIDGAVGFILPDGRGVHMGRDGVRGADHRGIATASAAAYVGLSPELQDDAAYAARSRRLRALVYASGAVRVHLSPDYISVDTGRRNVSLAQAEAIAQYAERTGRATTPITIEHDIGGEFGTAEVVRADVFRHLRGGFRRMPGFQYAREDDPPARRPDILGRLRTKEEEQDYNRLRARLLEEERLTARASAAGAREAVAGMASARRDIEAAARASHEQIRDLSRKILAEREEDGISRRALEETMKALRAGERHGARVVREMMESRIRQLKSLHRADERARRRELKRTAKLIRMTVRNLPAKLQGGLTGRVTDTLTAARAETTAKRLAELAETVRNRLAEAEYRAAQRAWVRWRSTRLSAKARKGRIKLPNAFREEQIERLDRARDAAFPIEEVYDAETDTRIRRRAGSSDDGLPVTGRYRYRGSANVTAEEYLEATQRLLDAVEDVEEATRAYRDDWRNAQDEESQTRRRMAQTVIHRSKARPRVERRSPGSSRAGYASRFFDPATNATSDFHTVARILDNGDEGPVHDLLYALWDAETAMLAQLRETLAMLDGVAKTLGYRDFAALQTAASGVRGVGSQAFREVVLGGERHSITLGQYFKLLAFDDEAIQRIVSSEAVDDDGAPLRPGVGLKFGDGPMQRRIQNITRSEIEAIREQATADEAAIVALAKTYRDETLRPAAFEAFRRLMGYEPPAVPNYEPIRVDRTSRQFDLTEDVGNPAVSFAENAGFTKERRGSGSAILLSDWFEDYLSNAEDQLRLAYMAEPARRAWSVLLHEETQAALSERHGSDVNEALRALIVHGTGMASSWTGGVINRLNSLVTQSYLALNPPTLFTVAIGGVVNLFATMNPATVAEGVANWRRYKIADIGRVNGYLWDRNASDATDRRAQTREDAAAGSTTTHEAIRAVDAFVASMRNLAVATLGRQSDGRRVARVEAFKQAWHEFTRVWDLGLLGMMDDFVIRVAFAGHLAQVRRENPDMPLDAAEVEAARRAERSIRLTQNSSSPLDDSITAAITNVRKRGAYRIAMPFSSDPFKQAARLWEWLDDNPVKGSFKGAGLAGLQAGVNLTGRWLWGWVTVGMSYLWGDDEDEAAERMLHEYRQRDPYGNIDSRFAAEMLSRMGVVGFVLGGATLEGLIRRLQGDDPGYTPEWNALAFEAVSEATGEAAAFAEEFADRDGEWPSFRDAFDALLRAWTLGGGPVPLLRGVVRPMFPAEDSDLRRLKTMWSRDGYEPTEEERRRLAPAEERAAINRRLDRLREAEEADAR